MAGVAAAALTRIEPRAPLIAMARTPADLERPMKMCRSPRPEEL
jgi:hypothetical protein